MKKRSPDTARVIYIKLVLTAVMWGGTFIAGRVVAEELGAFAAAFLRFAVASLCLLLMVYQIEGSIVKPKLPQLPYLILLGLSGVFAYNVFFFLGLQTTSAGRAALIVALNPIAIALVGTLVLKQSLSILKLLGIVTSLVGVAIVISQGEFLNLLSGGLMPGDLFIFGCVASWVIYTLVGKQVMNSLSPLVTTTYACLIGTIALLPFAINNELIEDLQQLSLQAGLGILYLGLCGSALGFSWYYTGVQAIGAAKASIFINLVPVATIVLAALLLDEPITSSLLVGGGLIVAGVFCTNRG